MVFQALPFADPLTGLVYARARWYDPVTGSFLSPDPLGYQDSSNLYAFAGGDPVNGRDPTGEDAYDDKYQAYVRWWGSQYDALWQRRKAIGNEMQRRKGVDVGALQGEDNILATRMLTMGGISEAALLYFDAARASGDKSVFCKSFEQIHAEIVSDEAVKSIGAAVVCSFMPHAPRFQRSSNRSTVPTQERGASDRTAPAAAAVAEPGDWNFVGPILPTDRPPVIGVKRPYNVAQRNPIPGYDNHHLNPPLGRDDPNYATGPTIPVRNDNAKGTVPGGENWHTGRGGFQQSLNEHIKDLGYTRAQWNNLPEGVREMHLRRYYASLGIPYP